MQDTMGINMMIHTRMIIKNNKCVIRGGNMKYKAMSIIVLVYSLIFIVIYTNFSIKQTPIMQFIVMFMTLGFLALLIASGIALLSCWKESRFKSFYPLTICIITIVYMIIAVPVIKDLIFNRNLPKYEKIVSMINRSEIDVDTSRKRIELPSDYKALAYATFGERDNKGVLTIEFFTGAGFPVKHSGYIYRSDGQLSSDSDIHKRWRYIKRKNQNWYYFSD